MTSIGLQKWTAAIIATKHLIRNPVPHNLNSRNLWSCWHIATCKVGMCLFVKKQVSRPNWTQRHKLKFSVSRETWAFPPTFQFIPYLLRLCQKTLTLLSPYRTSSITNCTHRCAAQSSMESRSATFRAGLVWVGFFNEIWMRPSFS